MKLLAGLLALAVLLCSFPAVYAEEENEYLNEVENFLEFGT
jgi:hypothetical protein